MVDVSHEQLNRLVLLVASGEELKIRSALDDLVALRSKATMKIFDKKVDELCFSILKSLDDAPDGLHMDFVIDDNADDPLVLIELAVSKLEAQGYIKIFKEKEWEKHHNYSIVYPITYTGVMGSDTE